MSDAPWWSETTQQEFQEFTWQIKFLVVSRLLATASFHRSHWQLSACHWSRTIGVELHGSFYRQVLPGSVGSGSSHSSSTGPRLLKSAASFFLTLKSSTHQRGRRGSQSLVLSGRSQMVCYPWRFSRCTIPTATVVEVSVSGFKLGWSRKNQQLESLPVKHHWGQRLKSYSESHPTGGGVWFWFWLKKSFYIYYCSSFSPVRAAFFLNDSDFCKSRLVYSKIYFYQNIDQQHDWCCSLNAEHAWLWAV